MSVILCRDFKTHSFNSLRLPLIGLIKSGTLVYIIFMFFKHLRFRELNLSLKRRKNMEEIKMVRELEPEQTRRAQAFRLWMKAPMPMLTFFKTLDVTRLVRLARHGFKFNALMSGV